jgi:Flp pilus assembly protein TadG
MMRLRPNLGANERGAAIIELALAAPFFAALAIGMIDLSRAYSMKLKLEQAAQRAIEKAQASATQSTDYTFVGTEAATAATAAGYSGSTATVDYWLECNGTKTSETTGAPLSPATCSSGQTYARYVTVTVSNTYTPFFASRIWPNADAQGNIAVSGYAGMRVQ